MNSPAFIKTRQMYFPNAGDVYVFNFSYGEVALCFLEETEKGYCFFNIILNQPCEPMDAVRFGYLIRKELKSYNAKQYTLAQVEEFKKIPPKAKLKKVTYKVAGLHHFKGERKYTEEQFTSLIDDINNIKF